MVARVRLPAIVPLFSFKPTYLVVWAPYIAAYQLVNRFPVFEPTTLDFTRLDHAISFSPWLLPLYVAYLPYYLWSVARSTSREEVNQLFYGTHLQLLVSLAFFVLYPVAMPRELFYGAELYGWSDRFWRWFDAPNNCFPSLHASNCLLLVQFNWRRPYRWAACALGLAIIGSAVAVKQHYVVDIAGGAGVYLIARAFLTRLALTGLADDECGAVNRTATPRRSLGGR